MKKSIATLVLALLCAVSLVACSQIPSAEDPDMPQVNDQNAPPTSDPDKTPAEDPDDQQAPEPGPSDNPEEGNPNPDTGAPEAIRFADDQLYAVAYLGWQDKSGLERYVGSVVASSDIPIHYISDGDFYLVVPRYQGDRVEILRNDVETSEGTVVFEAPNCVPFLIQCNVSNIFSDATIRFIHDDEVAEFSPFISLENGDIVVGDLGLDITEIAAGKPTP